MDAPTNVDVSSSNDERADASRLACGRIDATDTLTASQLDLSAESTEGGGAEVFRNGDEVVRIRGGLLGETFRLYFDYRYLEGQLVCASETITTLHTIYESEPEGPGRSWRFDFLFFDGPDLLSQITERTPADASPHHDQDAVLASAARLFDRASSTVDEVSD